MARTLLNSSFDPLLIFTPFHAALGRGKTLLAERPPMTRIKQWHQKYQDYRDGKAGYALLWLLGVPLPILALVYFLRGCN
jgi:hypothetical protein